MEENQNKTVSPLRVRDEFTAALERELECEHGASEVDGFSDFTAGIRTAQANERDAARGAA
jgi:hypothetical protein